MKNFLTLLIALVFLQMNAVGQTIAGAEKQEESFRVRLGLGGAMFSHADDLKNYLEKNGFGDKYNGFELFRKTNDYYPQSLILPIVLELAIEYRLSNTGWVGLSFGSDQHYEVKGYDRFGTNADIFGKTSIGQFVTVDYASRFLSPQLSFQPNESICLFGGPALEFRKVELQWRDQDNRKTNATEIGAMLGLRLTIVAEFELFAAYRWSPELKLPDSSNTLVYGTTSYTSTLTADEFKLNYLRMGLTYRTGW